MSECSKKPEFEAEVGTILTIYEQMMKGASQFAVTRTGTHLKFEAKYDNHPDLAKIKCSVIKDMGLEYTHDELTGWVYVELDSAIELVKTRELPFLTLIDNKS